MKVLTVIGTRPEAIKLAPVVQALARRRGTGIDRSAICISGQHRALLQPVLDLFSLAPDYDLDAAAGKRSLTALAAAILANLEPVLERERPDWVLVQGDTTTVVAAALAAFYAGVKVGHVEAGLRSHDRRQPFPEEINRRLAGVAADLHFAPTTGAGDNLRREGTPDALIVVTGNPVIDALRWVASLPAPDDAVALLRRLGIRPENEEVPGQEAPRLLLVTAHRRENLGEPLERICLALRDLAMGYGDRLRIVYPVHLNPDVRGPVERLLGGVPGITLLPPLPYPPLVHLMRRAHLVLTDSGGLQEEAPALGRPVLVLREVTERPEAVAAGTVRVIGTDRATIVRETSRLLDDPAAHAAMACAVSPYGDGHAGERIVDALLDRGHDLAGHGRGPDRHDGRASPSV